MTTFRTSADATRASQLERSNALARSITAKRTDRLVRPLKEQLSALRREDPDTPPAQQYGYGLVEMETDRIFREIDSQGRGHFVDVVSGDEIDGILSFVFDAEGTGFVYPGTFPGQLGEDGEILSGRFSGTGTQGNLPTNGSQIRLFGGTQQQADEDLVEQTSVDNRFIGRGVSYIWSRLVFQEGRFNGDPSLRVIARSRKVIDPRNASPSSTFDELPKTFSINPYRFIFDYLVRPKSRGGLGVPVSRLDIASFIVSTIWSEMLIDTQQFSKVAILTTRTNQQSGTPPINTNHLLEFEDTVIPFQYGDVVQINAAGNQQLPSNLSSNTDYFVVPIRHAVGDFQLPAIALADSLENSLLGITIPQGTRTSDINVTKVREIRFQSGVVYRSGEDILDRLLESCGAQLFLQGGKVAITSQRFPDPEDIERVELGELIGSIALSTRIDSDERATSLSGSYRSLLNLFIPKPYPVVNGGGVFAQQDGEVTLLEYNLPFVSKPSVAQRLATIELRRRRQELAVAFSGDLSLYRLKPNKIFTLDFQKYGLDEDTPFEVRDQTLFLRISNDVPVFGINIEARQLESTTFDLDLTNEEFVASAVIPGLQSPFEVPLPGTPQIEEQLFQTRLGAGVRSRAIVSWSESTGLFVDRYEVSFRLSGTETFFFLAETPELTTRVEDLQPGFYDFRVVAINSVGRRSDPSEALNFQIFGLAARPSAPPELRGEVIGAAIVLLRWDRTEDLDVREGGFIEIRHDTAISGAIARDSILVDRDVGGQTSLVVPFKQGTYFLRFEDSTGQFSDPAEWSTQSRRPIRRAQDVNLADLPSDSDFTIQEDNTFPSSNPGNTLIFVTDHLELPLEQTFDDEPDVDAIPDFDQVGGGDVTPSGLYFFSTDIELSAISRILIEAVITTEIFDLSASIDDEPDFDQIPDVDSVAAALLQPGLATAEVQVRFSNGTIASDTFGPWETIDTQFFEARSFQFRVLADSFVPTVNIRITEARVRLRSAPL
ncbi:MAG: hypothetical protein ACR2QF_05645 [Geminicoccaceae bacterium]